jgi:hypothetical protein
MAYVNPFATNLFYQNGKWYQTNDVVDENGHIMLSNNRKLNALDNVKAALDQPGVRCEKLEVINRDQIVGRYSIVDGKLVEENGVSVNKNVPYMNIPEWC